MPTPIVAFNTEVSKQTPARLYQLLGASIDDGISRVCSNFMLKRSWKAQVGKSIPSFANQIVHGHKVLPENVSVHGELSLQALAAVARWPPMTRFS